MAIPVPLDGQRELDLDPPLVARPVFSLACRGQIFPWRLLVLNDADELRGWDHDPPELT